MPRSLRVPSLLIPLFLGAIGCAEIPEKDESALILIPLDQEIALGEQAYQESLADEPVSRDPMANEIVQRVGQRIAAISDHPDWNWEFRVIDAPTTYNAFALPGGKVAVYTGILDVAENEAGLATVIGHEIAHAEARHGGRRITQDLLVGGTVKAADLTLADSAVRGPILGALGLGAKYGIQMPFGRSMESEADEIGLIRMAQAGYDPREAIEFWKRMQAATGGSDQPEFLSTHPATENRIAEIEAQMARALEAYESSDRIGLGAEVAAPR